MLIECKVNLLKMTAVKKVFDICFGIFLLGVLVQEYGSSLDKLHELSNAWEFHETEIMKSRAKLRSIRAKLAILEGKMGLEIMYFPPPYMA